MLGRGRWRATGQRSDLQGRGLSRLDAGRFGVCGREAVRSSAFDRLDVDGDRQLSGVELVEARELQFGRADRDGDDVLTFDELAALMGEPLR